MNLIPEKQVKRYLDDLLVELNVKEFLKETLNKFINTANKYWNSYDLSEYQEKANLLLKKYKIEEKIEHK